MELKESPVHADIETFRKAFYIFNNLTVYADLLVYTKQTYQIEKTVQDAKDLILTKHLSLDVTYNKGLQAISIRVVGELDRLDNAWGGIVEKLGKLQDQL